MSETSVAVRGESTGVRRAAASSAFLLPLMMIFFIASGFAALIYEIIWFQMLQFVIGSSAISLGVLLGTFMGGMCLGSFLFPRFVSPKAHPLKVYALLELGIGLCAIVLLYVIPMVNNIYTYTNSDGSGVALNIFLRAVVSALCLLPPTLLMGATLPAIARMVNSTPQGVSWLGLFYGGNTGGAVLGCLTAGFYLLRVYDMPTASFIAVGVNILIAVLGFALASLTPYAPAQRSASALPAAAGIGAWGVYVAIGLSGLSALGAEVVWTRLLSLLLGGTTYTFSMILAVFLMGLGIGSVSGSLASRTAIPPRFLLAMCQLLLAAAIAWTGYSLALSLPYWPVNPWLLSPQWHENNLEKSAWFAMQLDLVRCMWAILPPAFFWGASFPLAIAALATPGRDSGRLVSGVYAANTIGAIVGAFLFSLFLIQAYGTQLSQQVLITIAGAAAVLMFIPAGRWARSEDGLRPVSHGPALGIAGIMVAQLTATLLIWHFPETPWQLVAYGRNIPTTDRYATKLVMKEGMTSSVAVMQNISEVDRHGQLVRYFHVSGKVEASTLEQDMRLQRMLGHIPGLLHPGPKSVLIVGCGAGVTAGCFVIQPTINKIVICEIEPMVPREITPLFADQNYDVVHDKRTHIVFDDGRHFVHTTGESFDIITSDPINPWVKGAATLYTKEYFENVKAHLNPGGMVTQWVPLYESTEDAVKSEIATFLDVFPNGTIWSNDTNGEGYDLVMLGQNEPLKIDPDKLEDRLALPEFEAVARSLDDVGFPNAMSLLMRYGGQARDVKAWLQDAQINRDRDLRLQFLAAIGMNNSASGGPIYNEIKKTRTYPENIFTATGNVRRFLESSLNQPGWLPSNKDE